MKLSVEKGSLVLPSDLHFEMKITHPFFSEEGAATIPVSIPGTIENLAVLDHPARLGHSSPVTKEYPATLAHGIFHMSGKLFVSSAGESGVSCSFATKESILYSDMQDMNLKDIFAQIPVMQFGSKMDGNVHDALSIEWCNDGGWIGENMGMPVKGLTAFPVKVDDDGYGLSVLNDPGEGGELVHLERTGTDKDGNTMTYPMFFGLTPFITLWGMLDTLFEQCGYEVVENCFREEPLSNIVVLNNCADACVNNSIYPKDIVPDITVGKLLIWLKDKFGAFVRLDGNRIEIRIMEQYMNMTPDMDLTPFAGRDETVSFPSERHLVLDCAKDLEGAAPPEDLTIREFIELYDTFWVVPVRPENTLSLIGEGRLIYDPVMSLVDGAIRKGTFVSITGLTMCSRSGSTAFRYEGPGLGEKDERKTDDQFVPMVIDKSRQLLLPYIGKQAYLHTEQNAGEDTGHSQDLMVCWKAMDHVTGRLFGTTQTYIYNEEVCSAPFPLTPDGLYHMFWKTYNRMLLASAQEVEVELNLPVSAIAGMDLTVPKLFKGQRVLVKEINVEVSENGARCGKCLLQLIPGYLDKINDGDIYSSDSLKWKNVGIPSMRGVDGEITPTDGQPNWIITPKDPPSYFGERSAGRTRTGNIVYFDGTSASISWKEYCIAVPKR